MAIPTHLKSLQALEVAMRTGSLKNAGDALAITPAAVGQRIRALEDYLGIELLDRGRAGMRPRAELVTALPHLHRGFAELEAAARELDLQRGHELHIAAASDFVDLWLTPRLGRFREAHPNIRFCINGQGDMPMRLGQADCEISFGPVRDDDFVDLLFRDFAVPIGSPTNVERIMQLPAAARLEGFPLLHLDFYKDDPAGITWPHWIAANGQTRTAPERGIRFQRIKATLDAVTADAGIGLCGLALIRDLVADGRIQLPYPSSGIWTEYGFVARYRTDIELKSHVRRFRAWMVNESLATSTVIAKAATGNGRAAM